MSFLETVPSSKTLAYKECWKPVVESKSEIQFGTDRLAIKNMAHKLSTVCEESTTDIVTCDATTEDLTLSVWGPSVTLNCKVGKCFSCSSISSQNENILEHSNSNVETTLIHVGGESYYFFNGLRVDTEKEGLLYDFAQSLARVIGNGDDSHYCDKSEYCK